MKNGYFQLICSGSGTALKVVAPKDGGKPVNPKEALDYLAGLGLDFDITVVNKGIQDAIVSGKEEYLLLLNIYI